MVTARDQLKTCTGQDFGYDLEKWHNYLLLNYHEEYTFPNGWRGVQLKIIELIEDPHREELAARLSGCNGANTETG